MANVLKDDQYLEIPELYPLLISNILIIDSRNGTIKWSKVFASGFEVTPHILFLKPEIYGPVENNIYKAISSESILEYLKIGN